MSRRSHNRKDAIRTENPSNASGEVDGDIDLRSRFDNLTTILKKYPDYMYVCDLDTHEVLFMNDRLRSLLKDPKPGMKCHELFYGQPEPCDFCTDDLIKRTKMPHVWDNYNEHLDRHFLNTDQMITWHDGRKVRFETAIDITDQKKIEALLQASEKKYRSFIEQSTYGFFITDRNSDVIFLNDVAKEICGYRGNDDIRIKLSDIIVPEDLDRALKNTRAIAKGEDIARPNIYRVKRHNGDIRTVELQSFPIWRDDEITGFHGTVLDITERVTAEKELREKSEFLNAIIDNTSDGIFVVDEDINYVLINPASGRILGHDPEEWIGKRAGTNKHPDDEEIALESFMKVVNGERSGCEIRVKAKDGTYHLLDIRYSPMILHEKFHVLGMVTDITEKKRAENALRESRDMFSGILESKSAGIYRIRVRREGSWEDPESPPYSYIYMNEMYCDMTGISQVEHMADPAATMKIIHPDDYENFAKANEEANAHMTPFYWEGRVVIGDENRYFSFESHPHKTSEGDILWTGMLLDITHKKESEKALKESEEKYRSLFEFSPESIILLDSEFRIIECNRATESMFDMKRGDIIGNGFPEICGLDRKDEKYINGIFESLNTGARGESFEMEVKNRKDGSEMWIEIIPTTVKKDESFYTLQIISKNITDSKRIQREMRKKVMRFVLEDGCIHLEKDGRPSRAQDAFSEHLEVGFAGTLITRDSKKDYDKSIGSIFRCIRITDVEESPELDKHPPNRIAELVSELPRGEIVLINCLEYCISRMGVDDTVRMIHDIRDYAMMRRLTVLLSVDPVAVPEQDMRRIEKETRPLEHTKSVAGLPKKLRNALAYIAELDREGINPSYTEIGRKFGVSKPTVRSWMEALENAGAVEVVTEGRKKTIKITEKGKINMAV